jgi:hypothetical protein
MAVSHRQLRTWSLRINDPILEQNARIWLAFLPLTLRCARADNCCSSAAKMTAMQRPDAILSAADLLD